jgi:RNA polymerase sigma-70 factor (ECF subfamily)
MVDDTTGGPAVPVEADVDQAVESEDDRKARFDRDVLPLMGPLYGNAMRLTRNADDAADLVQSTFERAYKGFKQYRDGTNLKAWLFKIQNNAFINDYRKKQRQPLLADSDEVEDWQMHRAQGHSAVGLRSAETEVLETLPEQVVVDASISSPTTIARLCGWLMSKGCATREIAGIWVPDWNRDAAVTPRSAAAALTAGGPRP